MNDCSNMGHIFQILGRFNISLKQQRFFPSLGKLDWWHPAWSRCLTLNFSGDFAIQEAIGHLIHQLVIILFVFSCSNEDKNVEKMLWDILFCYFFPLISEYNATEFLAPCILYHSLGQGHWVGQIAQAGELLFIVVTYSSVGDTEIFPWLQNDLLYFDF